MTKEEVITYLEDAKSNLPYKFEQAIDMAIESLQAEAAQGKWIYDGQNFKGGIEWCHCSKCGKKMSVKGLSMYNFCPNCGVKMKGGAE